VLIETSGSIAPRQGPAGQSALAAFQVIQRIGDALQTARLVDAIPRLLVKTGQLRSIGAGASCRGRRK